MAADESKNFPASSESMRELFNMDGKSEKASTLQPLGQPPGELPLAEELEIPISTAQTRLEMPPEIHRPVGGPAPTASTSPVEQFLKPSEERGNELFAMVLRFIRRTIPYILVFALGLGLYFFYFSDFSFQSLLNSDRLRIEDVAKKNKDLIALEKQEDVNYQKWIGQFFFDVTDNTIISKDTDVSGNGLTNFQKYLLNLNPKVYSTRDGVGDGQLILRDTNPWTGKPLTQAQKDLIDKYFNKELISNRITAAALTRGVTKFAEYVSTDSPYYADPATIAEYKKNDQIITSIGSIPSNLNRGSGSGTAQASTSTSARSTGDEIDQSKPGRLDIPANHISVPLIWTQNTSDLEKDLSSGIVHYPGTVLPGEMGTSYISGHSSGYLWDRSPYKQVFAILGQVKDGTSFTITATTKSGQTIKYNYVVDHRGEFEADDQSQFVNTADSVVALSTCWPVGTVDRRLVLFAKLTQVERS
jgi:LPXTG-site transpeptidase (sortase) family protein